MEVRGWWIWIRMVEVRCVFLVHENVVLGVCLVLHFDCALFLIVICSCCHCLLLFCQPSGTVVSVNSWGYSSSSGMAGPNLSTETGSHAECLFERAKSAPLYGVANGGLVVYDC